MGSAGKGGNKKGEGGRVETEPQAMMPEKLEN